jgi:hypothetical protein
MYSTLTFLNLPKEVINLGVETIGLRNPNQIQNPLRHEHDILIVKLRQDNLPQITSQLYDFGWGNDVDEAKPIGFYRGARAAGGDKNPTRRNSISNNGLRPRGIVVPPTDLNEVTWFHVQQDKLPRNLRVIVAKGFRECRIIP